MKTMMSIDILGGLATGAGLMLVDRFYPLSGLAQSPYIYIPMVSVAAIDLLQSYISPLQAVVDKLKSLNVPIEAISGMLGGIVAGAVMQFNAGSLSIDSDSAMGLGVMGIAAGAVSLVASYVAKYAGSYLSGM